MERLNAVTDLLQIAGGIPGGTLIVIGGDRVEDLKLVEAARDHGIINRIILVGRRDRIVEKLDGLDIEIDAEDILHAEGDEQIASTSVELIKAGKVDLALKGNISTPILNRKILPLAVRPTVSLASVFDAAPISGGRPVVLTDAGVTTVCNIERMTHLIENAVEVSQTVVGIEKPRVAVLSANEKQITSLPSTSLALELARKDWSDAFVCGPLSFDLATDSDSVAIKGLPDLPNAAEVAGRADVLVCPGIDAANILYKTIAAMAKYGQASIAGITVGFSVPYIILSRADTLEIRLLSIALSRVYASRTSKDAANSVKQDIANGAARL